MTSYTVLVADDEALTRERIVAQLKKYPNFRVVAQTSNGMETLKAIKSYKPDVVLLDIEMPVLNGFEILKILTPADYHILVFITAHGQYAIKAFEQEALDYLLKPFDDVRFAKLVKRMLKHLGKVQIPENKYVLAKDGKEVHRIPLAEIIYIKSALNYVLICLKDKVVKKRTSLTAIQTQLDHQFSRIHRKYIINELQILKMKHICHGDYLFTMSNSKSIPSSKSYRETVKQLIG